MPTTSSTSIVTALGSGSGIDMTQLANNLAEAQFAARTGKLGARKETLDKQISAASELKSQILQLASALGDRIRAGDLAQKPQVANTAVATASSAPGLASGTHTLEVSRLASAQAIASSPFAASTSAAGSGSLTIRFGTVSDSSFDADTARDPVTVTIASGATPSDVASAINKSGAGISAYVAKTASGAQLVMKGKDGAANGFIVEATEAANDPGLAALEWNPATASADRTLATAADAAFRLDGLAMTSTSNTIANVAPGLSLRLEGTNVGAPTTIRFSDPSDAISTAMQDLTDALNSLVSGLTDKINPKTGELARDDGARAVRAELSRLAGSVVMPNAAAGAPRTLAALGLATNRDGTFRLDSDRLKKTLAASPEGAAAMFTTGLFGVYSSIDKLARSVTRTGDPRSLGASIARYGALKTRANEDLTKLVDQQETLRSNLIARFAKTDSRVGTSKATLSFLQNQIDAWNKG